MILQDEKTPSRNHNKRAAVANTLNGISRARSTLSHADMDYLTLDQAKIALEDAVANTSSALSNERILHRLVRIRIEQDSAMDKQRKAKAPA